MSTINHEEIANMTGENEMRSAPKYQVPIIKLQGEEGYFYQLTDEGKKDNIGKKLEGVILKNRRAIRGFTKTERYYSREYNGWQTQIELIESIKTEKGVSNQVAGYGTYQDLKKEFGDKISLTMVLYVLLKDNSEIKKIIVKGKGVSYLLDYFKEFEELPRAESHTHQYTTIFEVKEELNESLGKNYFAMTFQRGKKLDEEELEGVVAAIEEVHKEITKVENYYAKRSAEMDKPVQLPEVDADEIPVVEEGVNVDLDRQSQEDEN